MSEIILSIPSVQLKAIGNKKNTPEQLYQHVESMCMCLVMGVEEYLRLFIASNAFPLLIKILDRYIEAKNGDVITIILRALSLMMEHVPSAYAAATPHHTQLIELSMATIKCGCGSSSVRYNCCDTVSLLEEAMRLIRFVCKDDSTGALIRLGFVSQLTTVTMSDESRLVRQALETLTTVCFKIVLTPEKETKQKSSGSKSSIALGIASLFGKKKKDKNLNGSHRESSSTQPTVMSEVEQKLIPFLHSIARQYAEDIVVLPDKWALLELSLLCLGHLLQRAMLCKKLAIVTLIATADLAKRLFHILNLIESNIVLESHIREERVLFCETMLTLLADTNPKMMRGVLLTRDARTFFASLLNADADDITALLQDPFPCTTAATARSTQRRDKDHITSIAAIRILLLSCPSVPIEAFGPKPKLLLPVHQWEWEDDMRHNITYPEDQCIILDTRLQSLKPIAEVFISSKIMSVSLMSLKMYGISNTHHRNVSRSFVPFVFYNANEVTLRRETPGVFTNSGSGSVTKRNGPPTPSVSSAPLGSSPGCDPSNLSFTSSSVLMNSETVEPNDIAIAEEYLLPLCNLAAHTSGQMAKQSATCACVAMVQLVLISNAQSRAQVLLSKIYRPLSEMLRVALSTADKATKAVTLTMMSWMLHHAYADANSFAASCVRCGVPSQLEDLAKSVAPATRMVTISTDARGDVSEAVEQATRTAYLSNTAAALLEELGTTVATKGSNASSPTKRRTEDARTLSDVCTELLRNSSVPGTHEKTLTQLFTCMQQTDTMTSFEFYQIGVAAAVMAYLTSGASRQRFGARTEHGVLKTYNSSGVEVSSPMNCSSPTAANLDPSVVLVSTGPADAVRKPGSVPNGSGHQGLFPANERPLHSDLYMETHCSPVFADDPTDPLELLSKDRVACFTRLAIAHSKSTKKLVEQIVSVLPFTSQMPLEESAISGAKVSCRAVVQAIARLTTLSPMIALCQPRELRLSPLACPMVRERVDSSSPVAANRRNELNQFCPSGHRLLAQIHYQNICDVCNTTSLTAMGCRTCNYDLCVSCFRSGRSVSCQDSPLGTTPGSPPGSGIGGKNSSAACSSTNASQVSPPPTITPLIVAPSRTERAHLMATIGDIERFFRTGSSSTKNTMLAPAPQSALQNEEYFMSRLRTAIEHTDILPRANRSDLPSPELLRSRLRHVVGVFTTELQRRRALRNPHLVTKDTYAVLEAAQIATMSTAPSTPEEEKIDEFVRSAVEERYILYTPSAGRCPSRETVISSVYRSAFHNGAINTLTILENCLMRSCEGSEDISVKVCVPEGTTSTTTTTAAAAPASFHADPSDSQFDRLRSETASSFVGDSPLDPISAKQTCIFHHFLRDDDPACCCGEHNRTSLLSQSPMALRRRTPDFARCVEVHLLMVLHRLLEEPMRTNAVDFDATVFQSHDITTLIVKAANASALRVALLPVQFALPRWVYFAVRNCRFLMALRVRTELARFIAYGARKNLWSYIKFIRQFRPDKSIKVNPGEWARMSNHKYSVNRDTLLQDAFKVLRKCTESRFPVYVEFEGDHGTGQGPTAQFYTLVVDELNKAKHNLWRNVTGGAKVMSKYGATTRSEHYVIPPAEGLFPRHYVNLKSMATLSSPDKFSSNTRNDASSVEFPFAPYTDYAEANVACAEIFYLMGAALGRAFVDGQVFPLQLSPAVALFLARGIPAYHASGVVPSDAQSTPADLMAFSVADAELVDRGIGKSLRQILSMEAATLNSLEIPFTLPGNDDLELIPGGRNVFVTPRTLALYKQRVVSALLFESSPLALRFIATGCFDVVSRDALSLLSARELVDVVCGMEMDGRTPLWTEVEIAAMLVPDHGYQKDSPQIHMLIDILANQFTPKEQQAFLLFCTGCPRLPVGGVRAIGAITVAKRYEEALVWNRHSEDDSDNEDASPGTFPTELRGERDAADGPTSAATTPTSTQHSRPSLGNSPAAHGESSDGGTLTTGPRMSNRNISGVSSSGFGAANTRKPSVSPGNVAASPEEDWSLPSVNTCFRYLKLPPYPTKEMMYRKLLMSITLSGDTFELS